MPHVTYTGPSDRYDLSSADWKSLGVEDATKTSFERDVPYEVDDSVLEAVLSLPGMKEISDAKVEKLLDQQDADSDAPSDSSSAQTGIDASTTGTTTTTTSTSRRSAGGRSRGTTSGSTSSSTA